MDVPQALQNVIGQLQKNPGRYRCFGVYWWPLKKVLKAAGYGPAQLFYLGDYQDEDSAARVPAGIGLEDMLTAAFTAYGQNVRFPHTGGFVEDPEGELVVVLDEDAGGL